MWIWDTMHEGVQKLFQDEPERLLVFHIEDKHRKFSNFLGVRHRKDAWRKAHAS